MSKDKDSGTQEPRKVNASESGDQRGSVLTGKGVVFATLPPEDGSTSETNAGIIKAAPAVISGRDKSDPPPQDESGDIQYLSHLEVMVGEQINTLDWIVVEDTESPDAGVFVERCIGRDPESKKLRVVRIPGRRVKVMPEQVLRYSGSVVKDRMAVHTRTIVMGRNRIGYCFDKFFRHPESGKRYERCCYVPDRIHQAGLLYEKVVLKKTRRAIARIRRLPGSDEPMYLPIRSDEGTMRDLKRLFERHFLGRDDNFLFEEDPALAKMMNAIQPAM